jgi:Tol biopolymer transport system component
MPLPPGSRVGAYDIVELIGRGGMGEVYRARDSRLKRDVALKVLPDTLADKPDFARRFEQEAQAAAALNHPNIVAVYDVGVGPGPLHVVSELLEGKTLRSTLETGAIPMRQAIDWASQIAEGLAAAHDKGIVHRDIKPENVFITSRGRVKILDFGLAKVRDDSSSANGLTQVTRNDTAPGMLLGTVGYIAPEQVRGGVVDERADIFSFGAVVYEMLAGRRAFDEPTSADTLSAILSKDPPELPAGPYGALDFIVRRCLEKEPGRRFSSAADVGLAIRAVGVSPSSITEAPAREMRGRGWIPLATAAVIGAAAVAGVVVWVNWQQPSVTPAFRFTISPPSGTSMGTLPAIPSFAASPDGRHVAFVVERGSRSMLAMRSLDALESVVLGETEDAWAPFWSPDSRYIGFFVGSQLKKVAIAGGRPEVICDFGGVRTTTGTSDAAATWAPDGTIVFAGADARLMKVSPIGGKVEPATPVLPVVETAHGWPQFLPDGRHFLFSVAAPGKAEGPLYVGSLGDEAPQLVRESVSRAVYVEPGFLLSVRQGTLLAEGFDWERRSFSSSSAPVTRNVAFGQRLQTAFTVSASGLVVYRSPQPVSQLAWAMRTGVSGGLIGEPGDYLNPRLSSDDQSLAVEVHSLDATGQSEGNIWIGNAARGILTKLTFDVGPHNTTPVWSLDGTSVVYRGGAGTLRRKSTLAQSDAVGIATSGGRAKPSDWSRDGRILIYEASDPKTNVDIWMTPVGSSEPPVPFAQSAFSEQEARLSADGRWLAYASDESGRLEIYVRPFPSGPGKWRVSTAGGRAPRWRSDGHELFFLTLDGKVMAGTVRSGNSFEFDVAKPLFDARVRDANGQMDYEVTRDGQRFLINEPLTGGISLNVISNWRLAVDAADRPR